MPSTASSRLKFEIQAAGENDGTWGDTRLNNALKCLEEGISGYVSCSITTGDYTLTSTNYTPDAAEYRNMVIKLTAGSGVGARNVIVPGVEKLYVIHNTTGFTQTIKTSGGTGASVTTDPSIVFVYCDGTDCYAQSHIAGTTATEAAAAAVWAGTGTTYLSTRLLTTAAALVTLTDEATITPSWTAGINFTLTLGGNRTLAAPTGGVPGTWRYLIVNQDATGSRTITWNSAYKFAGGTDAVLSTAASAKDAFSIFCETSSVFHVFTAGKALA